MYTVQHVSFTDANTKNITSCTDLNYGLYFVLYVLPIKAYAKRGEGERSET